LESKIEKKLLILGAGEEQVSAISMAHLLGYKVIAVDGNKFATGLLMADVGIHADIRDSKKMIKIAKRYIVDGDFAMQLKYLQSLLRLHMNLYYLESL